jgi:hypothetical protein
MKRLASALIAGAMLLAVAGVAMGEIGWCGEIWPVSGTPYTSLDNIATYVQVWKPGVTDTVGQGPGIEAYLYYKCDTDVDFIEVPMTYNVDIGSNDEYTGTIPAGHGCSTVEFYIKVVDTTDAHECYGNDQAGNPPNFFLPITEVTARNVDVTFTMCLGDIDSFFDVCVTGSHPELTTWGSGVVMGQPCPDVSPKLYQVTVMFPAGSNPYVQYKYRINDCVDWDCDPNHEFTIDDSGDSMELPWDAWCWGDPFYCPDCASPVEESTWGMIKGLYR